LQWLPTISPHQLTRRGPFATAPVKGGVHEPFKIKGKPFRRFAAPPLEKGRIIAKTVLEGVWIQTEALPIFKAVA